MSKKSNKRPWRRLLKKQQRKRRRQKFAQDREKKQEQEQLAKQNDPLYKEQLDQQQKLEQLQKEAEEIAHNDQEEQWLRRELLAQKQFRREEQMRLAREKLNEQARQVQEKRLKEQESALRKEQEAIEKQEKQAAKEFEESMQLMEQYLADSSISTPPRLKKLVETRKSEKLCEFYAKTNCCRFGLACVYNHQLVLLSNILLIRHFFQHSYLDNRRHEEYSSAEEHLEVSEHDFQQDYAEFCSDVWPELESFGSIVNFRTVRNKSVHMKGHVFVEYNEKRSALKAFIKLQNRFYASKRLKVEFSHITYWRTAVCGLFLARKCPKGDSCNYLHLMQNPGNKYNTPLEAMGKTQQSCRSLNKMPQSPMNWNDIIALENSNKSQQRWRWSESPEIELKSVTQNQPSETSIKECRNNLNVINSTTESSIKHSEQTSVTSENIQSQKHKHNSNRLASKDRKLKSKSHKSSYSRQKYQKKHKSRERSPRNYKSRNRTEDCSEVEKSSKRNKRWNRSRSTS